MCNSSSPAASQNVLSLQAHNASSAQCIGAIETTPSTLTAQRKSTLDDVFVAPQTCPCSDFSNWSTSQVRHWPRDRLHPLLPAPTAHQGYTNGQSRQP